MLFPNLDTTARPSMLRGPSCGHDTASRPPRNERIDDGPARPKAKPAGDVGRVLNDPNLTFEDKMFLLLLQAMKHMQKAIEAQQDVVQDLSGKGADAMLGEKKKAESAGGEAKSKDSAIDVEMGKLQRLQEKRGQLFEMLKSILKCFDETAKSAVQSMGK